MPHRLRYPLHDTLPAPGEAIEVCPGVYWHKMPLPFALNHINLWLLSDGDGWCAVDAGYGTDETKALWQQQFSGTMAGHPLTRMVATHYHPDHIGLAAWLVAQSGASFHCSLGEFASAHALWHDLPGFDVPTLNAHFGRHGLPDEKAAQFTERGNTFRWGVPALPTHFNRLLAGDTLHIGGADWRCIPGYGHSPEHMALYCEAKGTLIAGDMLLPKISTNVGAWGADGEVDALGQFLDSLDRFDVLPPDTLVLPSHGRPFVGIHPRVEALKRHHAERLDALRTACATPQTAFSLLPVLFGRMFDLYQTMFALAECIAHLNYLYRRGALTRHVDGAGVYHFVQS